MYFSSSSAVPIVAMGQHKYRVTKVIYWTLNLDLEVGGAGSTFKNGGSNPAEEL